MYKYIQSRSHCTISSLLFSLADFIRVLLFEDEIAPESISRPSHDAGIPLD